MKNFFKKCLVFIVISFAVLTPIFTISNAPQVAAAGETSSNGSCDSALLPGMVPWYCGVWLEPNSEQQLKDNVTQIATNIAKDIVAVAGYLAAGFVIYGGYLYVFSSGDPAKLAAGKKTLTRAFIGLAIIAFADIIVSSIGIAFMHNAGAFDSQNCVETSCITAEKLVENTINWFIGIGGFVSAIFVLVGGIGYMTASGDPAKLQKSKNTILYALIGLAVVGLAIVITDFAIDMVNSANTGEDIRGPIQKLLNSIIGISSTVAVVFLVKGGINYTTSTGDPAKLKKAKDTILYSCIGLIICALTFVIVNWAINIINGSDKNNGGDKDNETGSSIQIIKPSPTDKIDHQIS